MIDKDVIDVDVIEVNVDDNLHDNKISKTHLGFGIILGFSYIFIIPSVIYLALLIIFKVLDMPLNQDNLMIIAQFLSAVLVTIAMLFLIGKNVKVILKDLFRDKTIGYAIIFIISIIIFSFIYAMIVSSYVEGTTANQEQVNQMMIDMPLLAIAFVAIGAPLVEELTFRYFAFNGLKLYMNPKMAILITTVLFAGVHLVQSVLMGTLANDIILFPLYLIPSFMITYSYYKTNMLAVPILIHIGYNSYQVVMFYLALFLQEQLESISSMVSSCLRIFTI